jgi:hypothetical protein
VHGTRPAQGICIHAAHSRQAGKRHCSCMRTHHHHQHHPSTSPPAPGEAAVVGWPHAVVVAQQLAPEQLQRGHVSPLSVLPGGQLLQVQAAAGLAGPAGRNACAAWGEVCVCQMLPFDLQCHSLIWDQDQDQDQEVSLLPSRAAKKHTVRSCSSRGAAHQRGGGHAGPHPAASCASACGQPSRRLRPACSAPSCGGWAAAQPPP